MKREFLQNFKVGDQSIPEEVIDAILNENSHDIGETKKIFADYDLIKEQLQTAKDRLKSFENVDVNKLQSEIEKLQIIPAVFVIITCLSWKGKTDWL